MSWHDRYRPASFRGTPFFVEEADTAAGRHTAVHEYIRRDLPFVEDLGRKARQFKVSGYVLGDDYMERRDELLRAAEEPGSGDLVHPYLGSLTVSCLDFSINETSREGRMARVSFTFIETGLQQFPTATSDRTARIDAAAGSVIASAKTDFADTLVVDLVPEWVRTAAAAQVTDLAALLGAFGLGGAAQVAADYAGRVSRLISTVTALVKTPALLADEIAGAIGAVRTTASNAAATAALTELLGVSPLETAQTTAMRRAASGNSAAVVALTRRVAISEAVRVAAARVYDSYDQAVAEQARLADAIDDIAASAPDAVFSALQTLRTELVAAVPAPEESLPRIGSYTAPATLPSLVVAYELYDDTAKAAGIVARNRIRHPGFVPGGRRLEVLTYA